MKTNTRTTWTSSVAMAGLLIGAGAILWAAPQSGEALEHNAQGPRWQRPMGPPAARPFGRIFRQLDLTEQQREAIRESLASERELHRDVHRRLMEARKLLHEAALRGEGESVLNQLAETVGSVEAEAAFVRARQFAGIVALLEPEQKAKLEELYAEAESHRAERREHFRRRHLEREVQ